MENATAARAIKAAPRPAAQRSGPTPNGTQPEPLWLSIARTTSDCAAVIDEDGLVRFCNDAGARVLCHEEPDRVKGQLLSDFRAKHHANERVRLIRAALETGRAVIFESINAGVAYRTVIHPLDRAQDGKRCALFLGRPTYLPRDRVGLDGLPEAEGEVHRARSNDLGPLAAITKRETEVLALIGRGMSTAEIADALGRSVKTIEGHRVSLGSKLGVNNRVELARIAIRAGLAPFDRNHHEEASPPEPDTPKSPAKDPSKASARATANARAPARNGTAVA